MIEIVLDYNLFILKIYMKPVEIVLVFLVGFLAALVPGSTCIFIQNIFLCVHINNCTYVGRGFYEDRLAHENFVPRTHK